MRLALLLSSGVESQDCHTVLRLAEAILATGNQVSIFLMADGVYLAPRVAELSHQGNCSNPVLGRQPTACLRLSGTLIQLSAEPQLLLMQPRYRLPGLHLKWSFRRRCRDDRSR